ncbi:MAG: TonB-dependent receptor [Acidobacteriota bacterium]
MPARPCKSGHTPPTLPHPACFRAKASTIARCVIVLCLLVAMPVALGAESLDGRILSAAGDGLGGITLLLEAPNSDERTTVTGPDGSYRFDSLEPGVYRLSFDAFDRRVEREVTISDTGSALDLTVDEIPSFADSMTVQAASRRVERLVDAPASISVVRSERLQLETIGGQVPRTMGFTVGAEPVQNGLYDFNFNTRGFNSFLNRRIQTIIDGRDPSVTDTSGQEWFTMVLYTDDLESVELVRGPSSALYGPNSVNGVLHMVTKAPRDSQGTLLRLTGGELETVKIDARWAGELGAGWFAKLLANHTDSETFTESRNVTTEYPGLPLEVVPLPTDRVELQSASVRADRYFGDDTTVLSLELGTAYTDGGIFMTPAQRAGLLNNPPRNWGRVNVGGVHWNFLGSYTDRSGEFVALAAGLPLSNESWQYEFELQGNTELFDDRLRLVGGVAYGDERVDSALYSRIIQAEHTAVFGQADFQISDRVKAVLALRWDEGDLYPSQVTPRGSLVFSLAPEHTLRLSYNEAFQVANYSELFVDVPAGPPIDLSDLAALLPPLPVDLGLAQVPIFDLGNPGLDVESVETLEIGYHGVLADRVLVSIDLYQSRLTDLIGSLPFGAATYLAPYEAPAGLPPELAFAIEAALRQALPGLTNAPDGSPFLALSRDNTGEIESRGVELSLDWSLPGGWLFELNGSYFDWDVEEEVAGAPVLPNRPDLQGSLGLTYNSSRLSASARLRWVDDFFWSSGFWSGPVPSYEVLDLHSAYELNERITVGLDISNALDDEHYEAFGGDVLGRRALGYITLEW